MNRKHLRIIATWILWIAGSASSLAADRPNGTAAAVRESACKSFQSEFISVLDSHADDGVGKAIQERLAALDAVADAVSRDLQAHGNAFADKTLATVGGNDKPVNRIKPTGAAKIVEKYQTSPFAAASIKGLSREEEVTVDAYFREAAGALTSHLQKRGKAVASTVGAPPDEISQLCFVITLLTSEKQPLSADLGTLPDWMLRADSLRALTSGALNAGSPRVAFKLSRTNGVAPTTAPVNVTEAYIVWVQTTAQAMFRARNYIAGLTCLRDGINVADEEKLAKPSAELRFQLAEALEATGSAKAAADEMSAIMASGSEYGHAAMLRLKYLYAAQQTAIVLTEGATYEKDARCAPYLPQILYIGWVAGRKGGGAEEERWRKAFLDKFPQHALAADIYFASAMDLLAASKYDEAARLLEFIEIRFPQSAITERVREIRRRLAAAKIGS